MQPSPLYQDSLKKLSSQITLLDDKPEETIENTLSALWLAARGNPQPVQKVSNFSLEPLSPAQEKKLIHLVERRCEGVPLGHLTGKQLFMDLEFIVSENALIPRKETEIICRGALNCIKERAAALGQVLVIDVCTGLGNLALSFAHYQPKAKVFAADLSEQAVDLARKNAVSLGLEDRVEFFSGDLLEPFKSQAFFGKVDVLTCNPPYISAGKLKSMPEEIIKHEPELAFNGGMFGISILSRLLQDSPLFLKPGGWLGMEIGLGQGPGIVKKIELTGNYSEVQTHLDANDNIRAITARYKGAA